MKLKRSIIILGLLFAGSDLFGQTNHSPKKFISSYDAASQSNVVVIASGSMDDVVPCPPEYTNVISNTNLFTPYEQEFLTGIPSNYGKVTTNVGPTGSVLISYKAKPLLTEWGTNWLWVARFQFTNSDLTDEVSPGGDLLRHKVRNKAGDGFDLNIIPNAPRDSGFGGGSGPEYWFQQMKHGVKDGLSVEIIHGDHCARWLCYSNGWAVDKWLQWAPYGNKLILWAKFKEPFDVDRIHNRNPQADAAEARVWALMGKRDECYDAARIFYKLADHWPTNMIELSAFAHSHSDDPMLGRFEQSFYKESKFTLKKNGDLVIEYQGRESFNGLGKTVVDVDKPKPVN